MIGLNEPAFILISLLFVAGCAPALNWLFSRLQGQLLMNVWVAMPIGWIAGNIGFYVAMFSMAFIGIPIDVTIDLRKVMPIEIWAYLAVTFLYCFVFYLSFESYRKKEILNELEKKKVAEATT